MGKPYPRIEDGQWYKPTRRGHKLACCDCGLVHTVDFRVRQHGRMMQIRAIRDRRATAALRREMRKSGEL